MTTTQSNHGPEGQRKETATKSATPHKVLASCESAELLGAKVDVYVLDGEVRVISSRAMERALNDASDHGNFGRFLARIIGESSDFSMRPIYEFKAPSSGRAVRGVEVTMIADLAAAIVGMKITGTLHHTREHLVPRAWKIMQALSKVALVALVDEATGYQTQRARDSLNELFNAYLLPTPGEWERGIPEELYVLVAPLYGYTYRRGQKSKPMFLRSWTWRYVYEFLPQEVRDEIQRKNPNPHEGGPKHHQLLRPEVRDVLRLHTARLISVVRGSYSVADFKARFDTEFHGGGLQLSFFDRRGAA